VFSGEGSQIAKARKADGNCVKVKGAWSPKYGDEGNALPLGEKKEIRVRTPAEAHVLNKP